MAVLQKVYCMLCVQEGSAEFVGYGDAVLTQLLAGVGTASIIISMRGYV
jgi:hypothetical protein